MYRQFHLYTCNCCIVTRTAHYLFQIISKSILFQACECCSRMSSSPNLVDLLCSIHYTYHQKHDEIDRFEELITTMPIIAKLEDKFTPHVVRICAWYYIVWLLCLGFYINNAKLPALCVVAYWCYYCRVFHGGTSTLQTTPPNNQHPELNRFNTLSTSGSAHHGASSPLLCHWHYGTSVMITLIVAKMLAWLCSCPL